MTGGINVWNGLKAAGLPEAGMAVFSDAEALEDCVGLAWILEEGSRKFYADIQGMLKDAEAVELFDMLAHAEEDHKKALLLLYQEIAGAGLAAGFLARSGSEDLMEGGTRVSEALSWARGKDAAALLQFSISLETNAYDLYLKMIRRAGDERSSRIFKALAEEEKEHLDKMGRLLDQRI